MRACLKLAIVGCLVACHADGAKPRSQLRPSELARVRSAAQTRVAMSTQAAWSLWSATPPEHNDAAEDTRWILTPHVIQNVQAAVDDATDEPTQRALTYLYAYLVGEALSQATGEVDERIGGLTLVEPALADVQPLLQERAQLERKTAKDLGLGTSAALFAAQKLTSMDAAQRRAEHLLYTSAALYQSLLAEVVERELERPKSTTTALDLRRLFALETVPRDAKTLLELADLTLAELGYGLGTLPIRLDITQRPHKGQRAACFPLQLPNDIRIAVAPHNSFADDAALLHELGHALHFAFTRTSTFEFAVLGDGATSEASAFLLEGLLAHETFLQALGVPKDDQTRLIRLVQWRRLATARRMAGQVLIATDNQVTHNTYRTTMASALGVTVSETTARNFLLDAERNFYAVDYLNGLLLAAQLEEFFVEQFGERFFDRTEVGELLRGFWHEGQGPQASEVALRITGKPLSDQALLRQVAKSLASPTLKTAHTSTQP